MIDVGQKIKAMLEAQVAHYRAMKQAVEKQTAYIEAMDIGGLTAGTSETRSLMRKIRDIEAELRPLRQSWNNLGLDRPVIEKRQIDSLIGDIRGLIGSIQETKDHNQSLLERSMRDVQQEMAGVKKRKKISNAYYQRPRVTTPARFIDKSK